MIIKHLLAASFTTYLLWQLLLYKYIKEKTFKNKKQENKILAHKTTPLRYCNGKIRKKEGKSLQVFHWNSFWVGERKTKETLNWKIIIIVSIEKKAQRR